MTIQYFFQLVDFKYDLWSREWNRFCFVSTLTTWQTEQFIECRACWCTPPATSLFDRCCNATTALLPTTDYWMTPLRGFSSGGGEKSSGCRVTRPRCWWTACCCCCSSSSCCSVSSATLSEDFRERSLAAWECRWEQSLSDFQRRRRTRSGRTLFVAASWGGCILRSWLVSRRGGRRQWWLFCCCYCFYASFSLSDRQMPAMNNFAFEPVKRKTFFKLKTIFFDREHRK